MSLFRPLTLNTNVDMLVLHFIILFLWGICLNMYWVPIMLWILKIPRYKKTQSVWREWHVKCENKPEMTLPKLEGCSEGQTQTSSDSCMRESCCRNPQPLLTVCSVSPSLGTIRESTRDAEPQSLPLNYWTWISIFTRSQLIVRH